MIRFGRNCDVPGKDRKGGIRKEGYRIPVNRLERVTGDTVCRELLVVKAQEVEFVAAA